MSKKPLLYILRQRNSTNYVKLEGKIFQLEEGATGAVLLDKPQVKEVMRQLEGKHDLEYVKSQSITLVEYQRK